ncbi:MAG TPA: DinB family protein [Fimbriimonadaceae bacterium]|nr:DinB family protein [Fimbriimonadaceae bacterium]
MSETLIQFNFAQELANWTRRVAGMYVKDLHALSDQAYTQCQGGTCRTMQDVTAECAGFNMMVTAMIKGDAVPEFSDEQRASYTASLGTREKGAKAIETTANAMADAMASNGHRMGEMVTAPWGETMNVFNLAVLSSNHMLYHDGQLNFVQSLNGDDKMHWFDE